MDIILNSNCCLPIENAAELMSQKDPLLNFLVSLGYDALNPPLGNLLSSCQHLKGRWAIVTPIHWEATHNDAMIVAFGQALSLSEAQIKHYFESFCAYLAEEGKTLFYHKPDTWLLCIDDQVPFKAKPIQEILNHSLMPELLVLDETMYWQKFFTENQMFFASLPNQSALNGVWLWGAASLGDKSELRVCADLAFMDAATQCSTEVIPYSAAVSLKDINILLINHLDTLSQSHQEELQHMSARWFWNDRAYVAKKLSWFTHLWRQLIHAH